MKPYIYLHQVQKEYLIRGQIPVVALRGIDLSVSQGEMIAVCGVSGSGKSTLLHIIGCLDKPTTGEYYLDDCNIGELKDAGLSKIRNRKIGFVLQDFGLIPYRTALENVSVPLTFSSRPSSEIKKRSMAALENMGIADLAKRKVSQMSGGQKQRVALARALVNDPDIILADEPTGALDSKTKIEILGLFKSIHDTGKTIIIVTHDSELAAITDRALHMTDGLIV